MKDNREKIVVRTSIISILANVVLAGFKAFVGFLANSIAIILDAVNNLSDALSSIITIIGTKLAGKKPDKKHPYGYGRIEYMTSLIVSAIVLYAGITALIESIKKIITPVEADYSTVTLVIIISGIIVKFALGLYVKKKGKQVNSDSLVASGSDAFNDAILSISVLASAIVYLQFHLSLEAYVGALLSVFIIKAGFELIKESIDNILGTRIEGKLAKEIKKEIRSIEPVQGAYDLVLHDYGPDKYNGSVHIEIPDTLTVAEIDKLSRKVTKHIMEKYNIMLHTVGIYSVNSKDKKVIEARNKVSKIVLAHEGVIQMHGFYIDEEDKELSLDIVVDFKVDRDKLYNDICKELQKIYKGYSMDITLDIDISD